MNNCRKDCKFIVFPDYGVLPACKIGGGIGRMACCKNCKDYEKREIKFSTKIRDFKIKLFRFLKIY